MIASILNLVGFLIVTVFFLGLYFEKIGPARIEDKLFRIPFILAIMLCFAMLQIAMERYDHNIFRLPFSFFIHKFLWACQFFLHEAGHIYWSIFGANLKALGGTLNEALLPLILSIYCFGTLSLRLAGLSTFFLGYNLKYTAWYISDATKQMSANMPMHGVHDWKYLLDEFQLIQDAPLLASVVKTLGVISIYLGVVVMFIGVLFGNKNIQAKIISTDSTKTLLS
jgi:hypothetical protein